MSIGLAAFASASTIFLCAVLLSAGILKGLYPQQFEKTLFALLPRRIWRIPIIDSRRLARTFAALELAVGGLLLVPWRDGALVSSMAAFLMFASFVPVTVMLSRRRSSCGCFGKLSNHPVDRPAVARAAFLALVALSLVIARAAGVTGLAVSISTGLFAIGLSVVFFIPAFARALKSLRVRSQRRQTVTAHTVVQSEIVERPDPSVSSMEVSSGRTRRAFLGAVAASAVGVLAPLIARTPLRAMGFWLDLFPHYGISGTGQWVKFTITHDPALGTGQYVRLDFGDGYWNYGYSNSYHQVILYHQYWWQGNFQTHASLPAYGLNTYQEEVISCHDMWADCTDCCYNYNNTNPCFDCCTQCYNHCIDDSNQCNDGDCYYCWEESDS